MKPTLALCLLALSCLLASQCDSPLLNPKTGPGTAYPCPGGAFEHPCEVPAKTCCPNGSACGDGFHGCPADACCYDPEAPTERASRDAGPGSLPICVTCRVPAR